MDKDKIISTTFSLLIISSATMGAFVFAVGNASAVHECSQLDSLVYSMSLGTLNNDMCSNNHADEVIEDMKENTKDKTETNTHTALQGQKEQKELFLAQKENYLQDSRSVAFAKGEAAAMAAIENGSTKAEAKRAANNTVADYYARHQVEMIVSWNTTLIALNDTMSIESNNNFDSNFSNDDNYNPDVASNGWSNQEDVDGTSDNVGNYPFRYNETVTLTNGTKHGAITIDVYNGNGAHELDGTSDVYSTDRFLIDGPDGEANQAFVYLEYSENNRYAALWTKASDHKNYVQKNIGKYVDGLYDRHAAGEINTSEYVNPITQAQEYSTQYNETGSWAYAMASLASHGYETPDLNGTGQMYVNTSGVQYEGIIMSQEAPNNGTWTVGTAYNGSNITGRQFMVTTSGKKVGLERNFTIDRMTDKDGNNIDSTTTKNYSYVTTNSSDYEDLQREMALLRQEIDDRTVSGGSGSTSSNLSWLTQTFHGIPVWGFGAAGLGMAYIASRRQRGY